MNGAPVDVSGNIQIVVSTDSNLFKAEVRRTMIEMGRPGMG
jgi:hypothetical protein